MAKAVAIAVTEISAELEAMPFPCMNIGSYIHRRVKFDFYFFFLDQLLVLIYELVQTLVEVHKIL